MAQKKPFSLRLDDEVAARAEKLAKERQRSLNWQLNELVKAGLAQINEQNEKPRTILAD